MTTSGLSLFLVVAILALQILGRVVSAEFNYQYTNGMWMFDCSLDNEILHLANDCFRSCGEEPAVPNPSGVTSRHIDFLGDDSGSLLEQCLDDRRGGGSSEDLVIDDLRDLADCCHIQPSHTCRRYIILAEKFIDQCVQPQVTAAAEDYFSCVRNEAGSPSCHADACRDNVDGTAGAGHSPEWALPSILQDQYNVTHCSIVEPFVDQTCRRGERCCSECNAELSHVVHALVNDVVLPYRPNHQGRSSRAMQCPVGLTADGTRCQVQPDDGAPAADPSNLLRTGSPLATAAGRRRLSDADRDLIGDLLDICATDLLSDLLVESSRYAAERYMSCVETQSVDLLDGIDYAATDDDGTATHTIAVGLTAMTAIVWTTVSVFASR